MGHELIYAWHKLVWLVIDFGFSLGLAKSNNKYGKEYYETIVSSTNNIKLGIARSFWFCFENGRL